MATFSVSDKSLTFIFPTVTVSRFYNTDKMIYNPWFSKVSDLDLCVCNRLQSELMALMMGGDSGIFVFPEEDNIFYWKGTINGSKDTVFEGTQYRLLLSFPNDYPFKPPTVKFETFCFHPNVDVRGHICLDILQKWSSAYDVRTILLSIQSSITEPNTSSPLNPQAVQLWSNQEEYRKMVVKLYKARNA
uniref:ubiquitin-conjugating enzyme E2 20-like n=1 Tax=Fragaria vesca subsp. vesca TaxID=101020 RepID=UPI0005CAD902|nr:PREDICTED: ubiquitin-conjugating enzyme E2 20-like [Fragaria vesca subsp. vesca]